MRSGQLVDRIFLVCALVVITAAFGALYGVSAPTTLSVMVAVSCPLWVFLGIRSILRTTDAEAGRR